MKKLLLIAALLVTLAGFGQDFDLPCADLDYKTSVASVSLFADGNQLKEPIIPLNNPLNRLTLWFDLLGTEGKVLNYTFIHCTNDWYPSEIMRNNYATAESIFLSPETVKWYRKRLFTKFNVSNASELIRRVTEEHII